MLQYWPTMGNREHTHAGERHENDAPGKWIAWVRPLCGDDQTSDRDHRQQGQPAERAIFQPTLPPQTSGAGEPGETERQNTPGGQTEYQGPARVKLRREVIRIDRAGACTEEEELDSARRQADVPPEVAEYGAGITLDHLNQRWQRLTQAGFH